MLGFLALVSGLSWWWSCLVAWPGGLVWWSVCGLCCSGLVWSGLAVCVGVAWRPVWWCELAQAGENKLIHKEIAATMWPNA